MATKKTTPQTVELGSVGFKHNAGRVHEEWLPELQGARGVRKYRELGDNISEIGASLQVIKLVATRAKWKFEPFSPDATDVEIAAFFDRAKDGMTHSWASLIRSALAFLQYGWSAHEVVMRRLPDGKIAWEKLAPRPPSTLDRWEISPTGEVLAMYQRNPSTHEVVKIPYSKLLNFRAGRDESAGPEGVSVLRGLVNDCYRYKRLCEAEAIGVERSLAGLPVMGIPATAMVDGNETYEAAKRIVQGLRADSDSGVVLPLEYAEGGQPLYTLSLLSASGSTLPNTSEIIGGLRKSITQALSTDFMLIGHSSTGSFALADNKTSMFETAVEGYLDFIAEEVQHKLVPITLSMNGWDVARPPKLVHLPLEKEDLARLSEYISKLVVTRVLTADDALETHVRQAADLPPRDPSSPARELPAAQQPLLPAPRARSERNVTFMRDARSGAVTGARIVEAEVVDDAEGMA